MGFFKTLFYKIGKAYKEINWLRWATLMVVFVAVELAILIPYYSSLSSEEENSSVHIESSEVVVSSSILEESESSTIIIAPESSKEESSSAGESSSSESSSSAEKSSSDESSSSESSSSEKESSSEESSSSESSFFEEESSSEESSSSESSSSAEESSSEESSSSESSSSAEESSSEESSSSESSSSEEESSSEEVSSSESSSSAEESSSEESSSSESSSSEEESSSEVEECEHAFQWTAEDTVPATCEEGGGIWKTCKHCGFRKFVAGSSALGHDYSNGVCTRCGEVEGSSDSSDDDSALDSDFADSSSEEDSSEESSSENESSSEGDSSEESSSENESSSEGDSSDDSSSEGDSSGDDSSIGDSSSENDDSSGEDSSAPDIESEEVLAFAMISDNKGQYYICKGFRENIDVEGIRNVVIPDTYKDIAVTQIDKGAFSYHYSLNSITIGKNITKIGVGAFFECPNLMEVYNLSSVKIVIGDYQKDYGLASYTKLYSNLTESSRISHLGDYIVYNGEAASILIGYKGNETALTIPDGITEINPYAFAVNKNVTSIVLSNSIKTISSNAFAKCESLKKVVIGSNVTSIGAYAFENTLLEELIFPEGDYTWRYGYETISAEYLREDAQRAASFFIKGTDLSSWGYTWERL